MRSLLLVRHGETTWNAERRLQGRRDISLSERGRQQIEAIRPLVASVESTAVVVSPLARAMESCDLLGLRPTHVDPRWQEADLGAWTGRTQDELIAVGDGGYAAWRAGMLAPPDSEPLTDLRDRVRAALEDIEGEDRVLVVTHGGPIRAVCSLLVGLEATRLVPVQPGSLTAFDLSGTAPRLRGYNVTPVHGHPLLADPPD